jgi:hypothetical protein
MFSFVCSSKHTYFFQEDETPYVSEPKEVEDISAEVNHNQNVIQSKTSKMSNKHIKHKKTVTKEDHLRHRHSKSNTGSAKSISKELLNGDTTRRDGDVIKSSKGGKKKEVETIHVSILLLLLHSSKMSILRITSVFILHHLGPVIPTSAILKNIYPPVWDLFLALA